MTQLFSDVTGWLDGLSAAAPVLKQPLAGQAVWVWLALVLAFPAALLVAGALTRGLHRLLQMAGRLFGVAAPATFALTLLRPVRLLVAVQLFRLLRVALPLTGATQETLRAAEIAVAVYACAWIAFRLLDLAILQLGAIFRTQGRPAAEAILPLLGKLAKSAAGILALLMLLQNLGFDVATLLAGLGIGGIAIALASQKSVENLLGGVMLVLDQPVRVGEFCRFNGMLGTVEDVGLRSTRVRGLDRVLVTIPNAEFSGMVLENFSQRDKNLLLSTIGIRYETDPETVERVIADLTALLRAHPAVDAESARVRLVEFADFAIRLELFAFVLKADWGDFLKVREEIFLGLWRLLQRHGTGFAFPSQTLYLARDQKPAQR